MASADAHTRLVTFAKIALPLLALAILSTLFLVSDEINPDDAIPYANIDVQEAAREQRLTNARYSTVGTDNSVIQLDAAEARPDPNNPNRITATTAHGEVTTPDGRKIILTAGGATIDTKAQTAALNQDVRVMTSDGYRMTAPEVTVSLERADVTSDGPVSAQTPFGTLDAGSMVLSSMGGTNGPYRLLFNNKVRLVYVPPK